MFRTPFVWEVRVRREVLEDELARLRQIPHHVWRGMLHRPVTRRARGRDNRDYRVRVVAALRDPGSEDIQVVMTLESLWLRRRLLRQAFVVTPDDTIVE